MGSISDRVDPNRRYIEPMATRLNRTGGTPHDPMTCSRAEQSSSPQTTAQARRQRRQHRHRARRKQGRFVVPVEVTCEMITALVDQGDVDEAYSSDLDCVGEAIAAAARRGLNLT